MPARAAAARSRIRAGVGGIRGRAAWPGRASAVLRVPYRDKKTVGIRVRAISLLVWGMDCASASPEKRPKKRSASNRKAKQECGMAFAQARVEAREKTRRGLEEAMSREPPVQQARPTAEGEAEVPSRWLAGASHDSQEELLEQVTTGEWFRPVVEVESQGPTWAATARMRNRHAKAAGTHFVPLAEAPHTKPSRLPLPERPRIESEPPGIPEPPSEELKREVAGLGSWQELFTPSVQKIVNAVKTGGGQGIVLQPEDHSPLYQRILQEGHTLVTDGDGRLRIAESQRASVSMKVEEVIRLG